MADYDGLIQPAASWADIPSLSNTAIALGGTAGAGVMNAQATAIAKRTNYLITYSVQYDITTANVGIGRTPVNGKLDVNGRIFTDNSFFAGSNAPIYLAGNSSNTSIYSPAAGQMAFRVANSATETMRLDALGNIGIGTTTPTNYSTAKTVEIKGTAGSVGAVFKATTFDGSVSGEFSTGPGYTSVGTITISPLLFSTRNLERMRIDSAGNVGVGTVQPSTKFVVSNAGAAGLEFGATPSPFIQSYNRVALAFDRINLYGSILTFSTGTTSQTERMRLDVDGNLGLGRSPVAYSTFRVLDVAAPAGAIQKWVHTGNTVELQAYAATASVAVGSATSHPLAFTTGDVERMRIDTIGNVGIGGTPPSNGRCLAVQNASTGAATFYLQNSTTGYAAGNGITLQLASTNGYLWNYNNGFLVFGTNNAERARIDSSGNLGVGTTTPSYKLDVTGQIRTTSGIVFPDSTVQVSASDPTSGFYVGDTKDSIQLADHGRWLLSDGRTIGNASSGATARANADTLALFTLIWDGSSNGDSPIQTSTGSASTRGASAAADFAANKRIMLPDFRGLIKKGHHNGSGAYTTNTTRGLLSYESDQIQSHTHHYTIGQRSGGDTGRPSGSTSGATADQYVDNTGGAENTVRNRSLNIFILR